VSIIPPMISTIDLKQSQSPFALSIDIGTSSVKTAIFDLLGRMINGSLVHKPVDLVTKSDGTTVIAPGPLLESVWACIDHTLEGLGLEGNKIAAVGCSTFVSNILGVDQDDRAATPIYTYADTRPAEDAKRLKRRFDEATLHQRTGCVFHPSYLPARFVWLERTQPELLASNLRWMSIGEYMFLKLFASTDVSYSVASWSGLLDWRRLDWDNELLESLPLHASSLSNLVDIDQPFTGLQPPFSGRWSVLKNIPWYPAIGDGAAANIGSGCYQPDRVTLTMGSTTAMRVVLPGNIPDIPPGLWNYRVDREHTLLGGALSEGGNIFAWLRKTLRFGEDIDLEAMLRAAPADQHGLTFLPLLAGERSPGWKGETRGAIVGLSLASTPEDIFIAAHEGIAYRIGQIYTLLNPVLDPGHLIVANGGALVHSPAWVQMVADVLGQAVSLSDVQEASARGAAMLALKNSGATTDLSDFPAFTGRQFMPDPGRHSTYQSAAQRQVRLYANLY
jgi:gluconokinase